MREKKVDKSISNKSDFIFLEEFNNLDDEKKKELEEVAVKLAADKEKITEKSLFDLKKNLSAYISAQ